MLPPITIPDLDPANPIDPDNDYVPIRQGSTDRKATVAQLNYLNLADFDSVPGAVLASDVLLLGRYVDAITYDNYKVPVSKIGFLSGTRMWFYMTTAPLYWTILDEPGLGDCILAVKAKATGKTYSKPNVVAGTWLQEGVNGGNPGGALTIDQIPAHTHEMQSSSDNLSEAGSRYYRSGKSDHARSYYKTTPTGGGLPHNHGNTWRPEAAVGIMCQKTDV